jgi:hypothetical protein
MWAAAVVVQQAFDRRIPKFLEVLLYLNASAIQELSDRRAAGDLNLIKAKSEWI